MKKIIIKTLITVFLFSVFSTSYTAHVHAYESGDIYGECHAPGCIRGMLLVMDVFSNPTCEEAGHLFIRCDSCGYSEDVYPSALGHNYKQDSVTEATCIKNGEVVYECTRCGDAYKETLTALGHDYRYRITKEATCLEEGERTYTCLRCKDSYKKPIEALGHDIEYEEVEPTCTKDGYKNGTCKRCDEQFNEVYPALGHKLSQFTTVKEATCTEDGLKKAVCSVCNEEVEEKINKLGHKYPDEWTIDKPSGYFLEGEQSKTCITCKEKIVEAIPKKNPAPLIGTASAIAIASVGIFAYLRSRRRTLRKTVKEVVQKEILKPDFEDKTILVSGISEKLLKALKGISFLEVKSCEFNDIEENAPEIEPDLIMIEVSYDEDLDSLLKLKEESLSDFNLSLLLGKEVYDKNKQRLDELKKEKIIIDYDKFEANEAVIIVKLLLPVLKPKLNSDESLGNIGMVADALNIPYVSKIIDLYVTGKDLKETLETEEKGVSETATIIGDIASILGLEKVASVAGLVDDIDSIKAAANKESGAYEHSAGIEGIKDVADVVGDIINKD